MLAPFADLRSLGNDRGIAGWLHTDGSKSFAALDRKQREHVFALLETCDANELRRGGGGYGANRAQQQRQVVNRDLRELQGSGGGRTRIPGGEGQRE